MKYKIEKVKGIQRIYNSSQLAPLLGDNHYYPFIVYPSRNTWTYK